MKVAFEGMIKFYRSRCGHHQLLHFYSIIVIIIQTNVTGGYYHIINIIPILLLLLLTCGWHTLKSGGTLAATATIAAE